jgi:hypothetical protein
MENAQHDEPPRLLMKMLMGAWVTQALGTLARLRVFDALGAGPTSPEEAARALGLNPAALGRVLRAVASVGVLRQESGGRFALTPLGELLRSDTPGSLRALFDAETAQGHWLPWGRLDRSLATGGPSVASTIGTDIWTYYGQNREEGLAFSEGMTGFSVMALAGIEAAYQPPPATRIVDVGGAHGAFLSYLLGKLPGARGILFDLPAVLESAGPALAAAGVGERVDRIAGDFLQSVPAGGDLYLLKHIVHDWDDERARTILANVRQAMAPRATVLVVEMLVPDDGSPSPALLLDLNMLVMLGGRERTVAEMRALFASAGLTLGRVVATPTPFAVLEATAP